MATTLIGTKCGNCNGPWCKECDACHACNAKGWKTNVLSFDQAGQPSKASNNATTQKALGMIALRETDWGLGMNTPPITGIIRLPETIDGLQHSFPLFARPCPERPRHGFVDSRIVNNTSELQTVLAETLAADPKGEVMLMPPIDAEWSAVLTPSLLTVGAGNDGATAGKDTISIPIKFHPLSPSLRKQALIGDEEDPYLEIVHGKIGPIPKATYLTQLRAGPKVGGGINYIPADTTVTRVISPINNPATGGDDYTLLDWEKEMEKAKGEPGVVVYHPGGSPTDHYSVHARLNKIPTILSDIPRPEIGSVLQKETDDSVPFSPSAVMKGIVIGERFGLGAAGVQYSYNYPLTPHVALMLVALYNSPMMKGEYGLWLGVASSLMLRLGSAALSGEARHAKRKVGQKMKERDAVYSHVLPFSLSRHRARLNRLINVLRYGFDGGGIGGEKWAKCGASLIPLFNAVALLAREPSEDAVAQLAKALNIAVDQAHNNGWWLNKFTQEVLFNQIQKGSIKHILNSVPALREVASLSVNDQDILSRQARYASWEPITFRPVRIHKATLTSLPNLPGLSFTINTRLLMGAKEITISAEKLQQALLPLLGQFYLIPGKNGLAVEMRKNGETIKIWEEKALL